MSEIAIVTGGAGWLGSNLLVALVDGLGDVEALRAPAPRTVRALRLAGERPARSTPASVQWFDGDVLDASSLEPLFDGAGAATVFHCAGVIHPGSTTRGFAVNDVGTVNVLKAAVHAGVRRFVHVSSNSPFGGNPSKDAVFGPDAEFAPYMGYGRSKMAAEQAVRAAPLESVIIRPPWFYGPGQPARQTLFFQMVRDGAFPIVGDGENRRSMAYVDNICQAMLLAERTAELPPHGLWVADRRPYSMNEIVGTLQDVMERDFGWTVKRGARRVPGFVGDIARVADGALQAVGLYQQKVHVLSEMNMTIACDIAATEQWLGYDPKIELAEGMRRSIAWMLETGQSVP